MPLEAAKRFSEGAIAQGGEAGNDQINPDPWCQLQIRQCRHLALGLESNVPVTVVPTDGAVFNRTDDPSGIAET